MSAVKAPPIDPLLLAERLKGAASKAGFRHEPYGAAGRFPLFALTKRSAGPRPRIYLSAGIHGDEPAPPLALLSLLESGELDGRAVWLLCPMINPLSLALGVRESATGLDLNRDYRHLEAPEIRAHVGWLNHQPNFDLAICVHEDWGSTGFYLYELNPEGRPSLAPGLIAAAAKVCPIDLSPVIDGRESQGGIIRSKLDIAERERWPESFYLQSHHTRLSYTIESPSSLPMDTRVAVLTEVLKTAIHAVAGPKTLA